MNDHPGRLERYAPLSGLLALGLLLIGLVINESQASSPGDAATPAEVLAHFESNGSTILFSIWICALGLMALLWFYGCLRTALAEAEGGSGRLATTAFGAGVASIVCLFGAVLPSTSAAIVTQGDDSAFGGEAAQALLHAGDAFFPAAYMCVGVMLAATATVVLRTRVLPRWFGIVCLVLALLELIPFVQWLAAGFLFPLWLIAASVLLYRRGTAPRARPLLPVETDADAVLA